jgi:hypothetical protein
MATQQDFDRLITQLRQQLATLGPDAPAFERMVAALEQATRQSQNFAQGLQDGQVIAGTIAARIADINDELGYTFKSFQSIINEMTKGRTIIGNITKGVKSLTDTAQKLINRQTEYGKLTLKELEKLKKQSALNFENLKLEREYLLAKERSNSLTIVEAAYLTELNGILQESIGLEASFARQINAALLEQKAIEESLGLTGALLKSIASIPGLQSIAAYLDVTKATEAMEAYSQKLIEAVKQTPKFRQAFYLANLEIQSTTDELGLLNEQLEAAKANGQAYTHIQDQINQKTGDLNKALAKRAELESLATANATGFLGKLRISIVGFTTLMGGLAKALTDPVIIFTTLLKGIGQISKETVSFQRNLGISAKSAQEIRSQFTALASAQEDTYYTSDKLIAAQAAYNEALGFSGKIIEKNALAQIRMTDMMGISADAANNLRFFAESTGKDLGVQLDRQTAITKSASKQYGVAIQFKGVAESVAKVSSYTRAQFGGSTEALTAAVAQAKALGTTLDSTQKSAKALMNFESSIQSELEAELLTGKQLNLERARYYALTNQLGNLTDELVEQAGDYNEFINMNAIAQQSLADATGKELSEISDILFMEQFRNKTRDQALAQLDDENKKRYEAIDLQQRFAAVITKLQTTLVNIAEGPLGKLAILFGDILSSATGLGAVVALMATTTLVRLITGFATLSTQFAAIAVSAQGTALATAVTYAIANPIKAIAGVALAGALVGGIVSLLASKSTPASDLFSPASSGGGRNRVLLGPEGAFSFPSTDNILATTNPVPVNDMRISSGRSGGSLQPIAITVQNVIDTQVLGERTEVTRYKTSA